MCVVRLWSIPRLLSLFRFSSPHRITRTTREAMLQLLFTLSSLSLISLLSLLLLYYLYSSHRLLIMRQTYLLSYLFHFPFSAFRWFELILCFRFYYQLDISAPDQLLFQEINHQNQQKSGRKKKAYIFLSAHYYGSYDRGLMQYLFPNTSQIAYFGNEPYGNLIENCLPILRKTKHSTLLTSFYLQNIIKFLDQGGQRQGQGEEGQGEEGQGEVKHC
jgi:hypothetical protein